jgi:hypothetical protein
VQKERTTPHNKQPAAAAARSKECFGYCSSYVLSSRCRGRAGRPLCGARTDCDPPPFRRSDRHFPPPTGVDTDATEAATGKSRATDSGRLHVAFSRVGEGRQPHSRLPAPGVVHTRCRCHPNERRNSPGALPQGQGGYCPSRRSLWLVRNRPTSPCAIPWGGTDLCAVPAPPSQRAHLHLRINASHPARRLGQRVRGGDGRRWYVVRTSPSQPNPRDSKSARVEPPRPERRATEARASSHRGPSVEPPRTRESSHRGPESRATEARVAS